MALGARTLGRLRRSGRVASAWARHGQPVRGRIMGLDVAEKGVAGVAIIPLLPEPTRVVTAVALRLGRIAVPSRARAPPPPFRPQARSSSRLTPRSAILSRTEAPCCAVWLQAGVPQAATMFRRATARPAAYPSASPEEPTNDDRRDDCGAGADYVAASTRVRRTTFSDDRRWSRR